ncbi:hypothetical protein CSKR_112108 [Clonorchis sinensis]|uniref:Uncharacterized protein n=1 Tax=Clonorchis sinensis TaxID=79923 RepID=A0A419PC79_CLOSI|nr:hypothetical protein CSKR_112108 [Clonorchis sinensis]
MPPGGSTRAGILPGCPNLYRGSREAEVGLEPWTFWSLDRRMIRVLSQSIWLKSLTARQRCLAGNANALPFLRNKSPHVLTPNPEGQETVCQTSNHRLLFAVDRLNLSRLQESGIQSVLSPHK